MQRRALNAVALAFGVATVSTNAGAQNRNVPLRDTPKLMVTALASKERGLGSEVANAIHTRMTSQMNPRQLYIMPKERVVQFLESSGYKADSALGLSDLKELAKQLGTDYVVGGQANKNGSSMHVEPRLMLSRDPSVGQPLPVIESTSLQEIGRQIERSVLEALKQMADNRACENSLREALDGNGAIIKPASLDKAIASAQAGIAKYPNAVIARLCLANAYLVASKVDDAMRVIGEIKKLDPGNKNANNFAFQALKKLADAEKDSVKSSQYRAQEVNVLVELLNADPFNQSLMTSVITELFKLGQPALGVTIVDNVLKQNPGDPQLMKTKWQLMMADAASSDSAAKAGKFTAALTAGEEMVKSDTALADSVYMYRQVSAATVVSAQKAIEWLSKATVRYPTNQEYWWYRANQERKAGQTQAASQSLARLLQLNAKYPNATVMLGQLFLDQKQYDSAVALARRSVAAGESRQTWGAFLLNPVGVMMQAASAADAAARADSSNAALRAQATAAYEAALELAQEADKLSPRAEGKYFIGVSSFQIGYAAVIRIQSAMAAAERARATKQAVRPADATAQRAANCADAKRAQDMFLLTMTNMPAGGSVSPQTAQQLLGATPQMSQYADDVARATCSARPAPAPATKAPATKKP